MAEMRKGNKKDDKISPIPKGEEREVWRLMKGVCFPLTAWGPEFCISLPSPPRKPASCYV